MADLLRHAHVDALRRFASTYVAARRTVGELRTRLVEVEHERTRWIQAAESGQLIGRPDKELAEIERVQRTLAGSVATSAERLHALEAIIASVAADVVARGATTGGMPTQAPEHPAPAPEVRPDAAVRGGWSAPPS